MIESPEGLGGDPAAYGAVIERQRDFFAARGQKVEWKTYDYDEPADLGQRLLAAGFVAEDDEALILGEAGPLAEQDLALPPGVVVRLADCFADFQRIRTLQEEVWGEEHDWVTESLAPDWARPRHPAAAGPSRAGARQDACAGRRLTRLGSDPAPAGLAPGRDDDALRLRSRAAGGRLT